MVHGSEAHVLDLWSGRGVEPTYQGQHHAPLMAGLLAHRSLPLRRR